MEKLETKDYKLVKVYDKKYVFLTGSQDVLKIQNPLLEEYFDSTCSLNVNATYEEKFDKLTSALIAKRESVHIREEPEAIPQQVMLTLNTTHACNMACRYCFAFSKSKQVQPMSTHIAEKAIKNLLMDFPEAKRYLFYFFGGEPLLCKDFIRETARIVESTFKEYPGKEFIFLLNTNGLLLNDKDLLAFFKQKDFAITVSIDGPQEVNDQNRLLQSGQGSFKHILANIEVLKQAGIKLNLRATISPRNQNLLNTFRFFENLAIPYAYAFTISASEKDEKETKMNQGTWVRTQQEYQQVFDFLTDKLLRKEEVFNMDFKQKLSILNQKTIRTHGCEAGRASFLVDELGRYFACQNMLPYQACIGELENGIVSSIRDRYKSQFVSELKDCQQCWARYLCGGGCQTERIFNASSQSMYCDISRFEWEQILLAHIKSKANKN